MLRRPATTATPPSTARLASWNPAVPPPPVTGAWLGTGLGEGLGDALSEGEALSLDAAGELDEVLALAGELAEVLALAGEDTEEVLAPGDNVVTDEEGVVPPDVQAESATQVSTVRAQPTAVSLGRCAVHAMDVRAFIGPPHTPGNDHFPVADRRNRPRK
jgi:hypothetical protein